MLAILAGEVVSRKNWPEILSVFQDRLESAFPMKDYLLHTLSPGDFETLVVKLCHQILGFGTISFSTGKGGGRDAFFEGTAERNPSSRDPWSGKFVIQAKHTERSAASCSERSFGRLLARQGLPPEPKL